LVLGNSGRTVLMGFDPTEHGTGDTDGDGQADILELVENQIVFLAGNWQTIGTDTDGSNGWQADWNTTLVPDGPCLVRATGIAGSFTGKDTHQAVIDNTLPRITKYYADPNPFSDYTDICYTLSEEAEVQILIYDQAGPPWTVQHLVRKYPWAKKSAGPNQQRWDGNRLGGGEVPDGTYYYRIGARDLAGNLRWVWGPVVKDTTSRIQWVVAPPSQMKAGVSYEVSWRVPGLGAVEETYVAYGHTAQAESAEVTTTPQNGEPGVYKEILWGSWSGRYYFTPVARLGGKTYYGPTVASDVSF
jgi:hypothetical protein